MKAHHSCRNRNTELAIFSFSSLNWERRKFIYGLSVGNLWRKQALSRKKKLSSKLKHIQFYFFVVAQIKLILSHILLRLKKQKPTKAVLHFDLVGGEETFPTIICWWRRKSLWSHSLDIKIFRRLFLATLFFFFLFEANKNLRRSFKTLWHTLTFFFHLRAQWFKKIFAFLPSRPKRLLLLWKRLFPGEGGNFIYLVFHFKTPLTRSQVYRAWNFPRRSEDKSYPENESKHADYTRSS